MVFGICKSIICIVGYERTGNDGSDVYDVVYEVVYDACRAAASKSRTAVRHCFVRSRPAATAVRASGQTGKRRVSQSVRGRKKYEPVPLAHLNLPAQVSDWLQARKTGGDADDKN